jgi:hypothetical protein
LEVYVHKKRNGTHHTNTITPSREIAKATYPALKRLPLAMFHVLENTRKRRRKRSRREVSTKGEDRDGREVITRKTAR